MNTITTLKTAAAGVLLVIAATACGTATAGPAPADDPVHTPGHIEPPRVVDGLDLVRQAIVE
ncbi:hypothetical protein [Nocardioides bigeumensis]|uniref:Uncharacterized protein n=1 Tax=Nocardioides bigeumensis TaxID=433657 RepID=A0ABN2YW35_9ACTN